MKLVRSSKAIKARRQVVEIAAYIVCEVMPEASDSLCLLGEDVTRISLEFQEDIGAENGGHYHKNIVLSSWSGHWGVFGTILIDRQNARLRVWGRRYFEINARELGTRAGNANIVAAVQDILVRRHEHAYVLGTEYETIPKPGRCCHDGILTISFRLQKKVKVPYRRRWGREFLDSLPPCLRGHDVIEHKLGNVLANGKDLFVESPKAQECVWG